MVKQTYITIHITYNISLDGSKPGFYCLDVIGNEDDEEEGDKYEEEDY